MNSGQAHEIVIEPNRAWLRVPWREILEYRDLLFLMVQRDFIGRYKQTVLGPLWVVVQPLVTTGVFTVVFGRWGKLPTDGLPPTLFYLAGNVGWSYFAQCFGGTSNTFVSNAGLFGKVYFPRLIVPLSKVVSGLIGFGIQFATFLVFWCIFKWHTAAGAAMHPQPALLLLPFLLVISAAVGLGAGLWMSAFTAKYRDLAFLSGFITQLWMYASLVVFPLSMVPERWRGLVSLNPVAGVVETFRWMFFGVGTLQPAYLALSAVMALALLLTGILAFVRTERTFIDTV